MKRHEFFQRLADDHGLEVDESCVEVDGTFLESDDATLYFTELGGTYMAHLDTKELSWNRIGSSGRHVVTRDNLDELLGRLLYLLDDQPKDGSVDVDGSDKVQIPSIPDYGAK